MPSEARDDRGDGEWEAALATAIRIGEGLQARLDAARAIAEQLPPIPSREQLLAALEGRRSS